MGFHKLPLEIRILVYSELLVQQHIPIHFEEGIRPSSPLRFRPRGSGLYPALLRVNKQIHSETIPFLYSKNSFQFPTIANWDSATFETGGQPSLRSLHIRISPFLRQIGPEAAAFIRHILMIFPHCEEVRLPEEELSDLELVREMCKNLTTLDLLLGPEHQLCRLAERHVREVLCLLDFRFKGITTLKLVIVDVLGNYEQGADKYYKDLIRVVDKHGWNIQTRLQRMRTER